MSNTKSEAVLLVNSTPIARLFTTANNGAIVSYGYSRLENGAIVESGKAKVSRNKKYLDNQQLIWELSERNTVYVNHANDGSC